MKQTRRGLTTGSLQTAGVGLVTTLLLMNGCAQPPVDQLVATQKSVAAAKVSGAANYAKDDFVKLEHQLALAKEELAE